MPAPQAVHDADELAPSAAENVPGGQRAHAVSLPSPKEPAGQVWQVFEMPSTKKVPFLQQIPLPLLRHRTVPLQPASVHWDTIMLTGPTPVYDRTAKISDGVRAFEYSRISVSHPNNATVSPAPPWPIKNDLYTVFTNSLDNVWAVTEHCAELQFRYVLSVLA